MWQQNSVNIRLFNVHIVATIVTSRTSLDSALADQVCVVKHQGFKISRCSTGILAGPTPITVLQEENTLS